MPIILPTQPVDPYLPPPIHGHEACASPARFRPQSKTITALDRHFGIELVADGPGVCVLCDKPGGYPFAGFFALTGGERVRLCDVCLFEESAPLGLVLAAVAFLRKVGRVSRQEGRQKMAAEIATFAHVFETLLNRRFGLAEPSQLLEHFAQAGKPPREH